MSGVKENYIFPGCTAIVMVLLCLILSLIFLSSGCGTKAEPITDLQDLTGITLKLPPCTELDRSFLAVTVDEMGKLSIITRETEGPDLRKTRLLHIKCDVKGQIIAFGECIIPTHLSMSDIVYGVYLFCLDNNKVLGWVAEEGLWIADYHGTELQPPKLILKEEDGSVISKWWLLKVGANTKLFVLKTRFAEEHGLAGVREEEWLYCYRLVDDYSLRLEGQKPIETNRVKSYEVECAAAGKEVYIWQTIYKKSFNRRTLRVARWKTEGELEWRNCCSDAPIYFAVDQNNGSIAVIAKQNPREFLWTILMARVSSPKPVRIGRPAFRSGGIQLEILSLKGNGRFWGVAAFADDSNKMMVLKLDDEFNPTTLVVPRPFYVWDTSIVHIGKKLNVVMLTEKSIVIQDVESIHTQEVSTVVNLGQNVK